MQRSRHICSAVGATQRGALERYNIRHGPRKRDWEPGAPPAPASCFQGKWGLASVLIALFPDDVVA
jgi:hypothetical protein